MDQQIEDNLKRVYAEALNEPLPDRFTRLLDELKRKEAAARPRDTTAAQGDES